MTDERPPFTSEGPSLCCISSIAPQRSLNAPWGAVPPPLRNLDLESFLTPLFFSYAKQQPSEIFFEMLFLYLAPPTSWEQYAP